MPSVHSLGVQSDLKVRVERLAAADALNGKLRRVVLLQMILECTGIA